MLPLVSSFVAVVAFFTVVLRFERRERRRSLVAFQRGLDRGRGWAEAGRTLGEVLQNELSRSLLATWENAAARLEDAPAGFWHRFEEDSRRIKGRQPWEIAAARLAHRTGADPLDAAFALGVFAAYGRYEMPNVVLAPEFI